MTRTKRNRTRSARGPSNRSRPRSPTVGTLLVWLIPTMALALAADWMLYIDMVGHYRKHGHIHFPEGAIFLALSLTCIAIAVPFFWLRARKNAG